MDGVNRQRTREDNRSQDDQERREEHGHEATATAQAGTAQIHWRKVGLPEALLYTRTKSGYVKAHVSTPKPHPARRERKREDATSLDGNPDGIYSAT
jgi:hypothetical protein